MLSFQQALLAQEQLTGSFLRGEETVGMEAIDPQRGCGINDQGSKALRTGVESRV